MAIWNDRWFAGESMPPNHFPQYLIEPAQSIAEAWLFDATFRCILTEWVSASQADSTQSPAVPTVQSIRFGLMRKRLLNRVAESSSASSESRCRKTEKGVGSKAH